MKTKHIKGSVEGESVAQIQLLEFDKENPNCFWLTTTRKATEDGKDKVFENIKILLDVRIFPKKLADTCKVGEGRQEPNIEPYLPPPKGRIIFALNPFKMLD